MSEEQKKKSVADIIINRFLADVDSEGCMPWQRPYKRYNAFNYFTMKPYHGINKLLLPFGEYITKTQINEYNKKHNEDFRFQKGIKWFPVVYFTNQEKSITPQEMLSAFPDADLTTDGYVGTDTVWTYKIKGGECFKTRNVLKYYEVADRTHFKNSKGEILPSRIELGQIEITQSEPKALIDRYVEFSGVDVIYDSGDTPCYIPVLDRVELNPYVVTQDAWFSTAFHEFAHSTGHKSRLNRRGIEKPKGILSSEKDNLYAEEECIAGITASLLCAECGLYEFETSESVEYENNLAYVNAWKKRVQDWGKSFIYIVSQADKAYEYILNSGKTV